MGKLIRTKIPRKILEENMMPRLHTVTGEELIQGLLDKLVEEAIEVNEAESLQTRIGEIGDLEEVLAALKKVLQIEQSTIDAARRGKELENGGFLDGVYGVYLDSIEKYE